MSCSPGMAFPPAGAAGLDSARHSFARQSPSGMSILACQFSIHPFVSQRTLPISSILCFVPGIVPAAANCPSGGPENTLPRLLAVFFPDTAACRGSLRIDSSAATACFSTRVAPATPQSAPPSLRTTAASGGFPPGATNSTGRASKRCVASTLIMEEPRTELFQLERTLGIRMERLQADGELQKKGRVRSGTDCMPSASKRRMAQLPGECLQAQVGT